MEISCVPGFNWAIASRFDGLGTWSDGSGTEDCAAGRSMTTGGVMVGWLVSRTTFSGHLCADLIRMAALSMISGRSGKLGGSSGKIQPAINRRTASALPTTIKYLAMGTAESSRELSNPGQPMAAMLDHTRVARQIEEGAPHRRIAHSLGKTTPRLEEILPQRVAFDAITMLDACTLQCSHNDIRDQLAIAFKPRCDHSWRTMRATTRRQR